ncbi:retrotransposon protein, putative, ty3-gypsy subclass [Tanacetum coccineum]
MIIVAEKVEIKSRNLVTANEVWDEYDDWWISKLRHYDAVELHCDAADYMMSVRGLDWIVRVICEEFVDLKLAIRYFYVSTHCVYDDIHDVTPRVSALEGCDIDDDSVVWFEDRLCVPNDQALRKKVMTEAHSSPFTIHPGSTIMYRDLKQYFWWNGMKQDVATFVSKCMTCQQVKIKHQRASGLLQPLEIPMWKWDEISMDFVTTLGISKLAVILTGNRLDSMKAWGTRLKFVQHFFSKLMVSQSPTILGTLEDMFTFRALDGRNVEHLFAGLKLVSRLIEGPELIEITNEKVAVAKEKLKEARSRQKSYADKHRRDLEFQVGDRVFLKVSPFRGVKRFGIKGKLSPRFIGPFEILERIGEVSYRLALPPQLSHVHDVFHVSLLRGYHYHPLHVASYPFDQIQPDMSLSEEPESILDRQERVMRNKVIPFVKILWKNHPEREATWETEESMRASYPHFFV